MRYLLWLVAPAQMRAQTFDGRHWIAVITEMFFDYLIVNLAQKAEKIQLLENQKNFQKSSKILKIFKISNFFDFFVDFLNFQIHGSS